MKLLIMWIRLWIVGEDNFIKILIKKISNNT